MSSSYWSKRILLYNTVSIAFSDIRNIENQIGHNAKDRLPSDQQSNAQKLHVFGFATMMIKVVSLLAAFLVGGEYAQGFYLPGVNPQSFAEGDV